MSPMFASHRQCREVGFHLLQSRSIGSGGDSAPGEGECNHENDAQAEATWQDEQAARGNNWEARQRETGSKRKTEKQGAGKQGRRPPSPCDLTVAVTQVTPEYHTEENSVDVHPVRANRLPFCREWLESANPSHRRGPARPPYPAQIGTHRGRDSLSTAEIEVVTNDPKGCITTAQAKSHHHSTTSTSEEERCGDSTENMQLL